MIGNSRHELQARASEGCSKPGNALISLVFFYLKNESFRKNGKK